MRFDFVATIKKRKQGQTHNKGSSYVRDSKGEYIRNIRGRAKGRSLIDLYIKQNRESFHAPTQSISTHL